MKPSHYSRVFTLLLITSACSAQTNPTHSAEPSSNAGFSIRVEPPVSPSRIGEPTVVTVIVINKTNHDILWNSLLSTSKDAAYMCCQFLLEQNGKEVETTYFDRYITGRLRPDDPVKVLAGSYILLPKPPGLMFRIKIDLTRLYKVTRPGNYTLHVSRYDDFSRTTVHAIAVTIRIKR